MPEEIVYDIDDVDKLYKLLFRLQGTKEFAAYWNLFPNQHPDPKVEYGVLNDETNRRLMVFIYSNGRLDVDSMAEKLALTPKEVRERLAFFRSNGMRKIA